MQDWVIQIVNQYGYFGIAILIAVENIFPPIPSEVILTFGGFLTTTTNIKIWGVVLSATIGSVLGAIVLYCVGRWLNPQRLEHWLDGKLGQMLHLKKEDIRRAEKWFKSKGTYTVFFCRFIPVIRSLISIPAGIAKMRMSLFLLLTTLGTFIWNIVLVYLGAFLGASWKVVEQYVGFYTIIVVVILALLFILFLFWFYKKRIKGQKMPVKDEKSDIHKN